MILGILQARCSSSRLPGKVLEPILGVPMVVRQCERLARSTRLDRLVVATSEHPSDDPLVDVLCGAGIEVRRGPLDDVAARFGVVLAELAPEHFVRLTADCPLTDPAVIDRVIQAHCESDADYTSNTLDRSYPDGLDVECVRTEAFNRLLGGDLTQAEREHVTLGLYTRPDQFVLRNVAQEPRRDALRWTVDVPEDLEFVRDIYARLYALDPAFDQEKILNLLHKESELSRRGSASHDGGDGP